jgi:hypothetical protein
LGSEQLQWIVDATLRTSIRWAFSSRLAASLGASVGIPAIRDRFTARASDGTVVDVFEMSAMTLTVPLSLELDLL